MAKRLKKIKHFIEKEIWNISLKDRHPRNKFFIRQLRIFILAIRGFSEDKVQLRASALTYYSLLSIVPILAMAFGIAKGFGFQEKLEAELIANFSGQKEVLNQIIIFVERYLTHIKGGFIAGTGLVMLIWSVMKVLGNIERSFNDIWQIKKSRVFVRKFSDYLSLVVIAPILLFLSSSVTVFLVEQVQSSAQKLPLLGYLGPILTLLVSFIPYVLIWLVFTLVYIILPNTKVTFKSAMIGGIIAGTMFQLLQWGYIHFQSLLSGYGAVYGGFAALPLFLIWLQTSWLIVLFGAEVSFANQNVEHYAGEIESLNISNAYKRTLSLLIVRQIIHNFIKGVTPMTAEELANKLDIPVRLVREIIYELLDVGIVSETMTRNIKENAYQPAIDTGVLSVGYVLDKLDNLGGDQIGVKSSPELKEISGLLELYNESFQKSPGNKFLKDI